MRRKRGILLREVAVGALLLGVRHCCGEVVGGLPIHYLGGDRREETFVTDRYRLRGKP